MAKMLKGRMSDRGFDGFRTVLRVGVSSIALGGFVTGGAALAQDRPQTTETEQAGETEQGAEPTQVDENVIVVSGIRQLGTRPYDVSSTFPSDSPCRTRTTRGRGARRRNLMICPTAPTSSSCWWPC